MYGPQNDSLPLEDSKRRWMATICVHSIVPLAAVGETACRRQAIVGETACRRQAIVGKRSCVRSLLHFERNKLLGRISVYGRGPRFTAQEGGGEYVYLLDPCSKRERSGHCCASTALEASRV